MEIWKDIKDYQNYKVSNLGNVKSLNFNGTKKEKKLKLTFSFRKYYRIRIYNSDKKPKMLFVHRIVADAFIDNIENKPFVNHINGIKNDNRVENLEWVTAKENTYHAIETGLTNQKGINHKSSKLKTEDVIYIRNSNLGGPELSKIYNVSISTISLVKRFKTYKKL